LRFCAHFQGPSERCWLVTFGTCRFQPRSLLHRCLVIGCFYHVDIRWSFLYIFCCGFGTPGLPSVEAYGKFCWKVSITIAMLAVSISIHFSILILISANIY
jgi:hypothetical protein